jgi:hypothetical protein
MTLAMRLRVPAPAAAAAAHGRARAAAHPLLGLQRTAGNRAVTAMIQRDGERRPSAFMPEMPTVSISAGLMQDAFASHIRPLTQREKDVATPVFRGSVDLERVRVATTRLLNAPTTLGNTIRVNGSMSDDTLVHELTHVWQYQTSGLRYVSCALAGQAEGAVLHGGRDWTYEFDPTHVGTHLTDYGPEQQAQIVQYAFLLGKLDETTGFYGPKVAEVRRARPRPQDLGRDIDEVAGLGPRDRDATPPLTGLGGDWRSQEMGGQVPQLQWRFNLP